MAAKGYTTKAALENYGLIEIDNSFDDQIDTWIEEIERYIEQFTGRVFIADETATARRFDGNGEDTMLVDDFIDLDSVVIKDTEGTTLDTVPAANIFLYPANTLPKTKITLYNYLFTLGLQNIYITAQWGYSAAVPSDIRLATTILVTGIINFGKGTNKSNVRSETIGRYSVSYGDEKGWQDFARAINIIESYKKYAF